MSTEPLQPTIDFLRRHAPFDQMAPAHLDFLAKHLRLAFFSRGEEVITPDGGAARSLYIIKQGRIQGASQDDSSNEEGWELSPGELFPVGALLARRPVHMVTRAAEDSFCFELDREIFDQLLQKSHSFNDFCTRRLASMLDNALRGVQHSSANRIAGDASLNTPLSALIKREPISCAPETPIREALETMHSAHIGSIIVCNDKQVTGIFTLKDLLGRVTLADRNLNTPISEVMTTAPLTLPASAMAHEAALLMAQRGFGHICVVDHDKLLGMISERDLFSLQRVGLANLSQAISRAESVDVLTALGNDIHHLIDQMLAQGASVNQLTQLIATLNDRVTRRVIRLTLAEGETPKTPFSWLAFGSEGRHEQTLKTDQDNGIIFTPREGQSDDEARQELLPLAAKINAALDRCGFPLCPGNIMASNPECCLSESEWRERFNLWIEQGTPEHLLKATIFFDFRVLFGEAESAEELRGWLLERSARNSRFRHQLAANAQQFRPPLGLFGEFKLSRSNEYAHTLDLKSQGLTPFVDAARLYALANQIGETNTLDRLQHAARLSALSEDDVAAWKEAYDYIQLLRMRGHQKQAQAGNELSNRVDPDTLNELDRRILKEAFRQGRKLQSKITLEYQL
ncbi:prohead protease [Solemya pervernicosa gill symbiont]|uniref:Prohead protease n=2 Tax=Gammaproteobacteria incertae sedis TaxID=118884 RepID=A0A1T2L2M5_9GAMM|nr:DUF294 nucleotidyltransferase-like domain-containing protein [Candidatus Reidiella endopervernicosa]OOZ39345.1 prohead protease [Solemya pervernicosa gill symbiont]QKQ26521.1 CBS domain-containing protein [Candidatus Reidiella endopervernicosa]